MAVNLSPVGGVAAQFFSNNGVPLTGGKLYTYAAGTTTPAETYTSSNGTTAWTNPVVLDSAGRVPGSGEIWLTDGIIYKFVLKDSNDVLIATYDNITGINSNSVSYTNQQEIVTATAGQTVFDLSISYQPATNSLSVFVDGVNQYGPSAQYAYVETDSNTVTFTSGLHVGAEVKFTTTQQQGAGAADASQVTYDPPFTGSVATNVEAKLAKFVTLSDFSGSDFGAQLTAAIAGVASGGTIDCRAITGTQTATATITINKPVNILWGAFNFVATATPAITIISGGAGTQFIGQGQLSIFSTLATSAFDLLYLNGTSDIKISNMKFEGNATGTDPSNPVRGIYAYQCSYVEIDSNTFDNLNYHIHLTDNSVSGSNNNHFNIHDNYFLSAPGLTNGGYGVLMVRCYRNNIDNNIMSGPFDRHAIYVSAGTRGTVVRGNNVGSSKLAAVTFNVQNAADEIYDVIIDGNNLKGDGVLASFSHGISVTGQVRHSIITNNIITNFGSYGINVQPASASLRPSALIISNNSVYANQKTGMSLAGVLSFVVSNNRLGGNGIDGVTEADIDVTDGSMLSSTNNNFSGNITNSGLLYGIRLTNLTANNYVSGTSGTTTRQLVYDIPNVNFLDQNRTGIQSPTSSAGVLNINAAAGSLLKVTLTESVTVTPNNYPYASLPGGVLEFVFTQNGTGGWAVAFSSAFKTAWSDTGNTANKVSSIRFVFDGTYYQQIGAQMAYH